MTEEKNTTPLHGSNVAREQIPAACKWQVSDIYAGANDWQAACEEYKSKLPQLQAMQGQLNTAAAVCAALKLKEELAKLLDASDAQMDYVSDAPAGHGLIKVGSCLVPFINELPRDTELYRLMTTKPGEQNA